MNWHSIPLDETLKTINATLQGLSSKDSKNRLEKYGPNEISAKERSSILQMVIEQFVSPLILILLAACIFSIIQGEWVDAIAIITVLVANATLGIIQQYKSEGALEALKKMSAPKAHVFRDGSIHEIPSSEVVPGDLVILSAGDLVPADLRLVETINLACNEAILTGESNPVLKDWCMTVHEQATVGDRVNMAFMGTVVTTGRGKGIAVATGKETSMGMIATSLSQVKREKTPLEIQLNHLGKVLSIVFLIVCAAVFVLGWLEMGNPGEQLLMAVSLAVAAIPEGLPAVVTIVLSIGTTRMSKQGAIIRRLSSVETLGCTTYICTDKTGTLTENRMKAVKVFYGMKHFDMSNAPKEELGPLAKVALHCNDAAYNADGNLTGDPTETALIEFAEEVGLDANSVSPRVDEIPFDSDRKAMTTVHKEKEQTVAYTKGAFEVVLHMSNRLYLNGKIVDLDNEIRKKLSEEGSKLTKEGYRTLGFAFKVAPVPEPGDKVEEHSLVLVGYIGLYDPIRAEVPQAVQDCKDAGIVPVMVTGDHPETAIIYARKLGIATEDDKPITGKDFAENKPGLDELIPKTKVFARVSPQDKLRIVEVLQKNSQVVAMTGDGVNDAPALKKADIGVSMGKSGSEVAKDAASLILVDDSFGTIVKAVHEGRVIYDNILKFIWYMLGANIGEVLAIAFSLIFMTGSPLAPIQLLWINLLTDGLPALALGVEPPEPGIMKRMPRDPKQKFLSGKVLWGIVFRAIAFGMAVYGSYLIGSARGGHVLGSTYAFATTVITELLVGYTCRSFTKTVFEMKLWGNPQLLGAMALSFAMFFITFIPSLQPIFKTTGINMVDLGIIVLMALIPPLFVDISKLFLRRYAK